MESQTLLELASETEILHLIYYRNKNQHRQASWWKFLSILRRKCQQLVVGMSEKSDSSALTKFILDKILPSAYIHFKGMVAQGQYINLGFALLACAAKIRALLLSIKETKSGERNNKGKTMQPVSGGLDLGETLSRDAYVSKQKADADQISLLLKDTEENKSDKLLKSKDKSTKSKDKEKKSNDKERPKKKKKKSKNAIDEIFGF